MSPLNFRTASKCKTHIELQLRKPECFAGYDLVGLRAVEQQELTPSSWQPTLLAMRGHRHPPANATPANAFAFWAVFARQATHEPQYSADRFFLLYLHAQGFAAYDTLYLGNRQQAAFLAIVNPSEGYGDSWTYFTKPDHPLHQLVIGNPAGGASYLLWGGSGAMEFYSTQACWPEYAVLVAQEEP